MWFKYFKGAAGFFAVSLNCFLQYHLSLWLNKQFSMLSLIDFEDFCINSTKRKPARSQTHSESISSILICLKRLYGLGRIYTAIIVKITHGSQICMYKILRLNPITFNFTLYTYHYKIWVNLVYFCQ